jgi:hypothetical protein
MPATIVPSRRSALVNSLSIFVLSAALFVLLRNAAASPIRFEAVAGAGGIADGAHCNYWFRK